MKKTNNKGFSLVELIIVIAIMAILAGAIAPALIRYIDKSRKSNDVSAAKTIKTAIETSMSNEDAYEALTTGDSSTLTDLDGNSITYAGLVIFTPSTPTAGTGAGVTITTATNATIANANTTVADATKEIGKNIGEKIPKIAYKKAADDTNKPTAFHAYISTGGSVIVGLGDGAATNSAKFYQLAPTVSKYYQ
ncbi:type II secretion system GspH family protein [Eubacterium sp. MSJ-21]|nr:type II secretion system GspH family protein [Eubacterium sp. MSJ-21]